MSIITYDKASIFREALYKRLQEYHSGIGLSLLFVIGE